MLAGLVASEVLDLRGEQVALLAGLVTAAYALALWRLQPRPLQHLACLAGLATATGTGVFTIGGDGAVAGLSVWTLGVLWSLAGWHGRLPPPMVALASGAVTVLVGAQLTAVAWADAGPVFGLASALTLVMAGATGRRFPVAAIGVAGVFVFLPWTVVHFFAGTLGVPVGILLCGVVLLTVAWIMLRARWPQAPTG